MLEYQKYFKMEKLILNPEPPIHYQIEFGFFEKISKTFLNMAFKVSKGINLLETNFDLVEKEITANLFRQGKEVVPVVFSAKIQICAAIQGNFIEEKGTIPVDHKIILREEAKHYVGGKILERHEVLKILNNDIKKLGEFSGNAKGFLVENQVLPFHDGTLYIERKQKSLLLS